MCMMLVAPAPGFGRDDASCGNIGGLQLRSEGEKGGPHFLTTGDAETILMNRLSFFAYQINDLI